MKVVDLKAYKINKKRDRIKHIRETILRVTGRRLSDDEIFDIYGAAVFVSELSRGEHDVANATFDDARASRDDADPTRKGIT